MIYSYPFADIPRGSSRNRGERPIVSREYGQGAPNPDTEQWAVPEAGGQQFPSQGYPPQQPVYGQPVYAQPYPQQSGNKALPWIIGVLGILLATVVGVVAYLGGTGAFQRSSAQQDPVVVTEVETQTLKQEPAQQQAPAPAAEPVSAPAASRQAYGHYAAASSNTSGPFAANVYSAFVDAYNSTGSPNVTVNVYSPVTGSTYTMSCSGGATVYCYGGDNARVKIW